MGLAGLLSSEDCECSREEELVMDADDEEEAWHGDDFEGLEILDPSTLPDSLLFGESDFEEEEVVEEEGKE